MIFFSQALFVRNLIRFRIDGQVYWIVPVVVMDMGLVPVATAAPTEVRAPVLALMV
jgi:uncharacterized membrane protein